jgi:hypothetical protein
VRSRVLGPEHPETMSSMHNLAVTPRNMGDLSRAWELEQRVVGGRTRVLGPEHMDSIEASIDLGFMMWEHGDTLD